MVKHLTQFVSIIYRVPFLYEMIATETDIDRRFQKLYFENKNIELLVSLETTARSNTYRFLFICLAIDNYLIKKQKHFEKCIPARLAKCTMNTKKSLKIPKG
jgi:hypothetical protein